MQVNWTATYRLDSTLVAPYERFTFFTNYSGYLPDHAPRDVKAGKSRHVAWFASNCRAPNGRKSYVEELQKFIGEMGVRQWRSQTMTATRYIVTATAMKTWKTNGVLLRNRQIHDIVGYISPSYVFGRHGRGRHCRTPVRCRHAVHHNRYCCLCQEVLRSVVFVGCFIDSFVCLLTLVGPNIPKTVVGLDRSSVPVDHR